VQSTGHVSSNARVVADMGRVGLMGKCVPAGSAMRAAASALQQARGTMGPQLAAQLTAASASIPQQ
jgi:hypothetical protein